MRTKYFLALTVAMALGVGCVGSSKGLSSEDKEKLAAFVLDSEPAEIQHKVDINFENKIHLIGYKAEPETARPGSEVKITWYWRCDDTLDDGWSLFTHTSEPSAGNIDNVGPLREVHDGKSQVLNPSRWEKGKVYVDEQTYKVPDTKEPEITFFLGIYKGDARLRIITGASDGEGRAIGAKLKTGLNAPVPQEQDKHAAIPSVNLVKLAATDKIVIDGKGDEKAWGGSNILGPFVEVGTGNPNTSFPVNATAKLAYDDQNLYVLAEVRSADVVGGWDALNKKPDQWTVMNDAGTAGGQPKLWTKDTIEIMIEPDAAATNKNYYEIQISPQNKLFRTQYDDFLIPKTEPNGPFGHEEWNPKIKSAVVVKGKLLDSYDNVQKTAAVDGGATNGYTVEAAIPFSSFDKPGQHAPAPGETWRINLYAMRQNGGVAWSPTLNAGSFHKADRFGRVTFLLTAPPSTPDAGTAPTDAGPATMPIFDPARRAGPMHHMAPVPRP